MKALLTVIRFTWPYLKKLRGIIFAYLLTAIFYIGLNNTLPHYVLGLFLDGLTGGTLTTDRLLNYCIFFLAVFLVNILLSYILHIKIQFYRLVLRSCKCKSNVAKQRSISS